MASRHYMLLNTDIMLLRADSVCRHVLPKTVNWVPVTCNFHKLTETYQTVNEQSMPNYSTPLFRVGVDFFLWVCGFDFEASASVKAPLTWRSHYRAHALLHVCILSYRASGWTDLLRTGSVVTNFEKRPFSPTICMDYYNVGMGPVAQSV
jgi:hypothetical protein